MTYKILLFLLVAGFFIFCPSSAIAHKVNVFAYSEAGFIYTESYFPGGKKVIKGKIDVYDSKGIKLLNGVTDDKGMFQFPSPKKDDLRIELTASLGHKSFFLLKADEIDIHTGNSSDHRDTADIHDNKSIEKSSHSHSSNKPGRHIEPPKEKNSVAILAGLGFIMGFCSLILHFTKRK